MSGAEGLLVLGLNGCGKSTLTRLLAMRLGARAMDVEDYYFPEAGPNPYAAPRSREEVETLMARDIRETPRFVVCSVRGDWGAGIVGGCALTVVLRAPLAVRMERIRQREVQRFGARVAPGGDLYPQQAGFRARVERHTEDMVLQSLSGLPCPVALLNAEQPPEVLACRVAALWRGCVLARGTSGG